MSIQHLVTMSQILPSISFSEKNIWFHNPLLTFWKRINQWPHKQRLLVRMNMKFMWGHTTDSFVLCTLCFVSIKTKCLGSWIWIWNFKGIFEAALFFVTIYFDGISEKNLIYFNIFNHPKNSSKIVSSDYFLPRIQWPQKNFNNLLRKLKFQTFSFSVGGPNRGCGWLKRPSEVSCEENVQKCNIYHFRLRFELN